MQNIGTGVAYDYGYDAQGRMYIWDKLGNKMVWFGDPSGGANKLAELQTGYDAKLNYQGDQSAKASVSPSAQTTPVSSNNAGTGTGTGRSTAKVLDKAQLASLDSLLARLDVDRNDAKQMADIRRNTFKKEKKDERDLEETKYNGKKLTTLQDFSGAKTDTDLNTRNTLENLVSSLSTMGLGGSRALTRQILDAANMSNRKANATQAKNNQELDSAWNEFDAGNTNDVRKIEDQYGYEVGKADKDWGEGRQTALYKKADVYNAADNTAGRAAVMSEGDSLNDMIARSKFMNPSYTGDTKAMATPDLGSYTQDIAKYDTTAIGAGAQGVTPVSAGATAMPGNLAIRALAVNDKDLGIKKKTEAELGYGV